MSENISADYLKKLDLYVRTVVRSNLHLQKNTLVRHFDILMSKYLIPFFKLQTIKVYRAFEVVHVRSVAIINFRDFALAL